MRVLFIIPSFRKSICESTKIRAGLIDSPVLSLAVLAAPLMARGHDVRLLDLNLQDDSRQSLVDEIGSFKPAFVGISVVTPLFPEVASITKAVKEIDPGIRIVLGGPHPTALPVDALEVSSADMAVVGEGDTALPEIVEEKAPQAISGLAYRQDGGIRVNPAGPPIADLDQLLFPAWQLYDLKKYDISRVWARKSPAGWIETSRGCPFNCGYCTKTIFGRKFRPKSFKRVVDEIQHYLDAGFRELHIADDMFTTDIKRVKSICDEIVARGMRFPWATVTGIRVDRGDQEMFDKMARSGCYRVCLGVESGSQRVLDSIGKGITLQQVRDTVRMAKASGMEVFGFFMMALPGETEETMRSTIDFACELDLDYAKVSITTPLPGTELFAQLEREGRIRTKDWGKYNLYEPQSRIYDHPQLGWDVIEKHYNLFWRRFYLRPAFMLRILAKSLREGGLFTYISSFLRTRWWTRSRAWMPMGVRSEGVPAQGQAAAAPMPGKLARDFERFLPGDQASLGEHILFLRHLFAYRFAEAQLVSDGAVLDMGCGTGYGTSLLSGHASEVVGLDADPQAVAFAQKKYSSGKCRFELFDSNGKTFPFADKTFDAVTMFQVIEHVQDDSSCLMEIARVLKPAGILVLATPNKTNRLRPGTAPWNPFHIREYAPDELASLLRESFDSVQMLAVRASAEIEALEAARIHKVNRLASLDPFNWRHQTPKSLLPCLIRWLEWFGFIQRLCLMPGDAGRYRVEDFSARAADLDQAMDLLAICRDPRSAA